MIKLKNILLEGTESDLVIFLKKFKSENPNASEDEISNGIISYLEDKNVLTESPLKNLIITIATAAMLVYGATESDAIAKKVSTKIHQMKPSKISNTNPSKISNTNTSKIKKNKDSRKIVQTQFMKWIEKYAQKYDINKINLQRLFERETRFDPYSSKYNPKQVGDIGNTLGPSYGPGQIKVVVAKEIYTLFPEPDVNPNKITANMLKNDVEFNIRTAAKILNRYYHKEFKHIEKPRQRMAYAATAYNAGLSGAKNRGINAYGKQISGQY